MVSLKVLWPTKYRSFILLICLTLFVITLNLIKPSHHDMLFLVILFPFILSSVLFGLRTSGWIILIGLSLAIPQFFDQENGIPFFLFYLAVLLALFIFFQKALTHNHTLPCNPGQSIQVLLQKIPSVGKSIDCSEEAVMVLDLSGHVSAVSPQALNLLGVPAPSLKTRHVSDALGIPQAQLHGQSEENKGEFVWISGNEKKHIKFLLRPLLKYGKTDGQLLFLQDFTEEKARYDAYLQTAKFSVIGDVASGLAHELRNPLTTIKGFMQLIPKEEWPESFRPYHQLVLDEIQTTDRILKQFLLLTNPSAPHLKPLNPTQIVNTAIQMVNSTCLMHEVSITCKLPTQCQEIMGDEDQLLKAFLSILQNAIDASPAGEKITVTLFSEDGFIRVYVIDQGPGIAEELKPRVFDPFFTTDVRKTGLGLTIAQQIIQAHHGQLILGTPEMGRGTRVTLSIPSATALNERLRA